MESKVYPAEGFPFLRVEIRGLQRSMTPKNLGLPMVVARAVRDVRGAIRERGVRAVLGMGGYVTLPAAYAARRAGVPLFVSEQNASAGLANRIASRWATRAFASFPDTHGLRGGVWVGNPVRRPFWAFDRDRLRPAALERYGLDASVPVVGVFGGSLGSKVINDAVVAMLSGWSGPEIQVLHLVGDRFASEHGGDASGPRRVVVRFEDSMDLFYAACDLVVARSGGGVAELTATGTPSILVPGAFGSAGHQEENARFLETAGAAVVVPESDLGRLGEVVAGLLEEGRLPGMAESARSIGRPRAAHVMAQAMLEAAR